jgi:hypothetical protein
MWAKSRLIALPIKKQLQGASCAIPNATSVIMPDLATTAINAAARAGMIMVFFVTEVTAVVVLVPSSVAGSTGHHHHPPLANMRPTVDAFWGTRGQDSYAAEGTVAEKEDKTVLDFVILLALAVIRTGLAATCAAFLAPAMGTHMELRRVARKRYTAHTALKQPRVLLVWSTTLVCVTRNVAVVTMASVQFAGANLQQ